MRYDHAHVIVSKTRFAGSHLARLECPRVHSSPLHTNITVCNRLPLAIQKEPVALASRQPEPSMSSHHYEVALFGEFYPQDLSGTYTIDRASPAMLKHSISSCYEPHHTPQRIRSPNARPRDRLRADALHERATWSSGAWAGASTAASP